MSLPRLAPACLALIFALSPMTSPAAPRDAEWKQIEEHFDNARPQSAIEALNTIEAAAKAEKAWAEVAKAVAYRITAESEIQGHQPEEPIRRYEAALTTAPAEIAPVLKSLLADAYWSYFEQNRWRIL